MHEDHAPVSFYGGDQEHMGESERFNALMERETLPSMFEGSRFLSHQCSPSQEAF